MKKRALSIPAVLIALFISLAVLIFTARIWLSGAAGCARAIGGAVYSDPDELAREEPVEIQWADNVLTDAAYDAVFPDLIEPAPEE